MIAGFPRATAGVIWYGRTAGQARAKSQKTSCPVLISINAFCFNRRNA
jgi:dienelactone hydrolase